jgi:hypothetical protein
MSTTEPAFLRLGDRGCFRSFRLRDLYGQVRALRGKIGFCAGMLRTVCVS